ncbi:MAG: TSUP family transporter, partial [Hyphomicrobiaceae bacterium]
MTAEALLVVLGAFAGGFISGLTGFGTGLTALPVWLLVLSPIQAASLVVVCSVVGQLQTLPAIWHKIDWRRVS